jgi:2,3-bisphosphoglycerate-independent phosphoglycerate mutase
MNETYSKSIVLLILDGWGQAPAWGGNAISVANTHNFNNLWKHYPNTTLCASGECVGLPGHERGNSEVGHLNLGSGRVMKQDSSRITDTIKNGTFFENKILIESVDNAKKNNSNLHIMGLVSNGGIHSHIEHFYAMLDLCKKQNFDRVFLHCFTDGRDSEPMSAISFISHLNDYIKKTGIGKIATISGRYFAMDRDNHWERTSQVYNAMVNGVGVAATSALAGISSAYNQGITDEFIPPIVVNENDSPIVKVRNNDSVIFMNFRSDRARQISIAFLADNFKYFSRGPKINNLFFAGLIPYGYEKELKLELRSAFTQEEINNTLAQSLSLAGFRQFHTAETEKYAHVTYFFNGGRENPFPGEERLLIPSPRIATYDLKPEMSIREVNDNAISKIRSKKYGFILVNYANTDMVGHTGNFKAALQACEIVDYELAKIAKAVLDTDGLIMVTADHGNIEQMVNPVTGEADTEHTRNPVPFILVGDGDSTIKDLNLKSGGILADIAPTILELMQIEVPKEMNGNTLLTRV